MTSSYPPSATKANHTPLKHACPTPLRYVHIDEALIVVEKPPFLLTAPGQQSEHIDALITRVKRRFPDAGIVHRLDMDTSGLLVLAKGKTCQKQLNSLFQQRQVHKQYEAIVLGRLLPSSGVISLPIAKDWPNRPLQKIDFLHGKPSTTAYERLEYLHLNGQACTRLRLYPLTGRSHQLRIHLRATGHPILGCDLYGNQRAYELAERLFLHATTLRLPHPLTRAIFEAHSAAPF